MGKSQRRAASSLTEGEYRISAVADFCSRGMDSSSDAFRSMATMCVVSLVISDFGLKNQMLIFTGFQKPL